jgi:hypothetical protein
LEKLTESIDRIVEFTRGDGAAGGSGDGAGSFGGARFGGGFQAPLNDGDDVDATSTIFLN